MLYIAKKELGEMSYSDKVQAAVNSAHETAIANKIIDMMQRANF